jgi:hypothetical protein
MPISGWANIAAKLEVDRLRRVFGDLFSIDEVPHEHVEGGVSTRITDMSSSGGRTYQVEIAKEEIQGAAPFAS